VIEADDEYDLEDANVLLAKFDNGVIGSFITSPLPAVSETTFHLWVVGFDLWVPRTTSVHQKVTN